MIRSIKRGLLYAFLIALATVMIYPLLWMAGSSFKENQEIFTSLSIFRQNGISVPIRRAGEGTEGSPIRDTF